MPLLVERLQNWAPLFASFWLFGYIASRLGSDSRFLRVPAWLFYLCGAPKSKKLPRGGLTRLGAFMQITALLILVFALCFELIFQDKNIGELIGLWASILASAILVRILQKRSL